MPKKTKKKVPKKQTGGKVLTLKAKAVSEEKMSLPIEHSGIPVGKKTKLFNNRDYPGDDLEIWKGNKLKGKVSEDKKCYDLNGKAIKCPKKLR